MIKKEHIVALLLITAVAAFSCKSTKNTSSPKKWNLAAIYDPTSTLLHPVYKVWHQSDEMSVLYLKLYPAELRFANISDTVKTEARISVQYTLFEIIENKLYHSDSATIKYNVGKPKNEKRLFYQIPLKIASNKQYQLKIITRDLLQNSFNLQFIDVDKSKNSSNQWFNFLSRENLPNYTPVAFPEEVYRFKNNSLQSDSLYISFYGSKREVPNPLMNSLSDSSYFNKPDSIWKVKSFNEMFLQFSYPGLYSLRYNTDSLEGFYLHNISGTFPKVEGLNDMLEPLKYIVTQPEYDKISTAKNLKLAIDNHWIKVAGSKARAREMIRIFYNRVYFANYYFTNVESGWRTDRGMVFVIKGLPDNIYKTAVSETWIYNRKESEQVAKFVFNHEFAPYASDNYILDRSNNTEWYWTESISAWNNGDLFFTE